MNYKSDEFIPVYIDNYKNLSTYDGLQFHYKKGDQKYKIAGLEGVLFFSDKSQISKCHKKQNEIYNEIKSSFKWRGTSDTEVLLNAWSLWKTKTLEKIDGMFKMTAYFSWNGGHVTLGGLF